MAILVSADLEHGSERDYRVRLARILVTQLVFGLGFSSLAIVPKMLETTGRGSARDIGHAMAMLGLGAGLCAPLAGLALDRIGRVRVIRVGATATALSLLAFAASLDVPALRTLAMLIAGSSFVFVFNGTSTLAADVSPSDRVARSIGWLGSAGMIAHAASPALAEMLAPHLGWERVFAGASTLCIASIFVSLGLEEPERPKQLAGSEGALPALVGAAGRLGPMLLVCVLAGGAYAAIFAFHQPLVLARGGTDVRGYFVGFTLGALVMRLGFGSLPDRIGHARATRLSLAAYAVVAGSFAFVQPAYLLVFGVAHGVAHGVFYPACAALGFARTGPTERGMSSALLNGSFNAGHAFAAFGYGALAQATRLEAVFLAAAIAAALALLVAQRGTRTE